MNSRTLYTFLLLCMMLPCFAQINLGLEKTYLQNMKWSKVMVCADDLTVFALSGNGSVYYKKSADANFQVYAPAVGLKVTEVAGYSFNEVYLLVKPNAVFYVKDGNVAALDMAGLGVVQINNIAVVNASKNNRLEGYFGKRDWLAIAADNSLYYVFREEAAVASRYMPISTPGLLAVPGWRITNSGYKSIDFQYKTARKNDCYGDVSHAYFNKKGTNDTGTVLPEFTPYSQKINCTLFEPPFNEGVGINENDYVDFWGTDDGVYAAKSGKCDPESVRKALAGEVINDLEELNFLRSVSNQRFLLVAGSKGLHFSTVTISFGGLWTYDKAFNFYEYPPLENIKVNNIATEVTNLAEMCEMVVWLATDEGLKQLSVAIEQPLYGGNNLLSFSEVGERGRFDMCPGREITMTANVPANYKENYYTRWFKDDVELVDLRGLIVVTFKEPATYTYKLTALCAEVSTQVKIWLRRVDDPVITFKPAAEINICPGDATIFTTRKVAEYKYKWLKNGLEIPNAIENTYTATEAGTYQLQVSNCNNGYISSTIVKVNVIVLIKPVITKGVLKSLCFGESVLLRVPVINGATYQWSSGETTAGIEVKKAGNYTVEMKMGSTCAIKSDPVSVTVADEIVLNKPANQVICALRQQYARLTAPEGFAFYTWNGQKGTSNFLEVTAPGEYTLEIEDLNGCKAITLYQVVSKCEVLPPPNAFSPNGDGINDLWLVEGLEADPNARIQIYNRYGILVFTCSGERPVWDGKSGNKDIPAGVYYYLIFSKNMNKPLKGSVAIIR
ncbi:MAG: gliding motility-associated C-terminal domain-containing protein [Sphingobacteriaceae bacterium]